MRATARFPWWSTTDPRQPGSHLDDQRRDRKSKPARCYHESHGGNINAGGATTFTAAASGTPAPTVQWQVNTGSGFANISDGGVYSGSATGTLTITGADGGNEHLPVSSRFHQ